MKAQSIRTKRLATVKLVAELYPAFTQASLRWLIFNEQSNGFNTCTRRLGRKVLIDLDAFESYINSEGGNTEECSNAG